MDLDGQEWQEDEDEELEGDEDEEPAPSILMKRPAASIVMKKPSGALIDAPHACDLSSESDWYDIATPPTTSLVLATLAMSCHDVAFREKASSGGCSSTCCPSFVF